MGCDNTSFVIFFRTYCVIVSRLVWSYVRDYSNSHTEVLLKGPSHIIASGKLLYLASFNELVPVWLSLALFVWAKARAGRSSIYKYTIYVNSLHVNHPIVLINSLEIYDIWPPELVASLGANGFGTAMPHILWTASSHFSDVIMASQVTSLTIVYSTVYSGADQTKHQSSASLAFVTGIHRSPVNSPHKGPVTRKMFLFDDVIMGYHNHLKSP